MKKNYTLGLLMAGTIGSLAFVSSTQSEIEKAQLVKSHALNSAGAPSGRTGAPGEQTCTECHTGTLQNGAENSLIVMDGTTPVTSYVPGQTYNVAVTFTGAGTKNGFEAVALNTTSNAQAGTMITIPGAGTQVINGSAGKKYVTHTTAGNTQTAWAFQWTAPATDVGDIKFYLATNKTNANGASTGDQIRVSQHLIGSTAGIKEHKTLDLQVGFASSTGQLVIDMNALSAGKAALNLVDLNGRSVYFEELGAISIGENQLKVRLPETITSGIYVAHISVDNTFASQKIAIQK